MNTKIVWVCGCDAQTQYECGGLGRENCPYCRLMKVENLQDTAYPSHPFSDKNIYYDPKRFL